MTNMFSSAQDQADMAEVDAATEPTHQITGWDNPTCRTVREAMEADLAGFEAKYGVKVKVGSARYTSSSCTFKVEVACIGEGGEVETKERTALKMIHPTMVDKIVEIEGVSYKVIGYKRRAPKYCWVLERVRTGKVILATNWHVGYGTHRVG